MYTLLLAVALAAAALATRQLLLARIEKLVIASQEHQTDEFMSLAESIDPATGRVRADDPEALFQSYFTNHVPAQDQAFYTFLDGQPFLYSFGAPTSLLDDEALVEGWTADSDGDRRTGASPEGEILSTSVPSIGSDDGVTGTFVVVNFLSASQAEVADEVRMVLILGSVLVVVAGTLATSFSRRLLRPVREVTTAAMRIEESDLSVRAPVAGDDEMGELSRSFNDMLDRLEESFRWQRVFLDDVAHELRTPITIARGHLGLVKVEREQQWRVDLIDDELGRMTRSVDELLVVSKAARPDFLTLSVVDVHDLLHDVITKAHALAPRSWALGDCPKPGRVLLYADAGRLEQALLALAANAAEHTADGDSIVIAGRRIGESVELSITDSGPGIDPSIRDHLFTRFSRAASSEAGRPAGMGLGLAIVASIAAAHDGRVDVDSTPGNGATFTVVVPYRDLLTP